MSRIVIFGSSSGLGSCLIDELKIIGHNIIPISSSQVDFNSEISIDQIHEIIEINQPDVIINCAGVLGNNQDEFNKIFNINLRSNWIISKYFINNIPTSKQVKIIFIGSSAYQKGKKDYILYASSKAALFNLFEGLSALFENTKVIFGLVNPTRMDTKMIKELTKTPGLVYLDPKDVAHTIINFITKLEKSTYLNL
jgi:ribitol-5-phosphate 2-dehydrogenase (NADP+) / D-ribitol-5-phosphate cytidylyltransferase